MGEQALFTTFWENESTTTRNVIARIPEGSDYRPDPKSRIASEIAWQIACEEKMIIEALETGKVEWNPPPAPATMKELLEIYEKQSADIVRRWKALPAARWDGTLEFFWASPTGVTDGVELPLRHRAPSRADLYVPTPDGIDRPADLRA